MIDVDATIRSYIAGVPAASAIFDRRIYAARNLPSGYLPEHGPVCLFAVRGGGQAFSSAVFEPSVQVRIYAATEAQAREAAGKLYDAINDTKSRQIIYARMEDGTLPTMLSEPMTDWPYILMYFKFFIQNEV